MKISYLKQFLVLLLPLINFSLVSCSMDIDDYSNMSSKEMIESLIKNTKNARITVGIVQNGKISSTVYGKDGKELPYKEYI